MEIKEEIRSGRVMPKEVVVAAAEKLAAKRNEKLTKEMMQLSVDAEFEKKTALLKLQQNREEEGPIKEALTKKGKNEDAIKEGKMTPEEFKKSNNEIDNERDKALRAINEEFYSLRNQLRKQCYDVLNDWED